MLFDGEAAFDTIRHLIYKAKETWTPRVHKDLKYLSFFFFFSVGLENYTFKLLGKGETWEVTCKTQTPRITQHTWKSPVKQTHGSGFRLCLLFILSCTLLCSHSSALSLLGGSQKSSLALQWVLQRSLSRTSGSVLALGNILWWVWPTLASCSWLSNNGFQCPVEVSAPSSCFCLLPHSPKHIEMLKGCKRTNEDLKWKEALSFRKRVCGNGHEFWVTEYTVWHHVVEERCSDLSSWLAKRNASQCPAVRIFGPSVWCVLSEVPLFATPWTVVHQPPLSLGFSRKEYYSALTFPSPGDLPDPGTKPQSPALAGGILYHWAAWEVSGTRCYCWNTSHCSWTCAASWCWNHSTELK